MRIGKGACIVRSVIRGPTIVGENVEIVDSKIGPFTAIGDGVRVVRSTVEHSVVMAESGITDLPRLEDPGAEVANDTDPARLRSSPALPGVAEVAFGDASGDSLAFRRRRRSPLGRAFDAALQAALAHDEVGTRRAVQRIARLDPRAPGRLEIGAVNSVAGGAK